MSRMCACLLRLRHCTKNEYSPEGNRCQKSKVRYDTPKYPIYVVKSPGKNWQIPHLCGMVSNMGAWALHWQLPRMSSCYVPIYTSDIPPWLRNVPPPPVVFRHSVSQRICTESSRRFYVIHARNEESPKHNTLLTYPSIWDTVPQF